MSQASLLKKKLEEINVCGICKKGMTNPRCLPCLHSFCESCLEKKEKKRYYDNSSDSDAYYDSESGTENIKCMTCSRPWPRPYNGIKSLPKNFILDDLLQASKRDQYCPTHPNLLLVGFCFQCSLPVCAVCHAAHSDHENCLRHEKALERFYGLVDAEISKIEPIRYIMTHYNNMQAESKLFDKQVAEVKAMITKKAKDTKAHIDSEVTSLVSKVKAIEKEINDEIAKLRSGVSTIHDDVLLLHSTVQRAKRTRGLGELAMMVDKAKKLSAELVAKHVQVPKLVEYHPPTIAFVPLTAGKTVTEINDNSSKYSNSIGVIGTLKEPMTDVSQLFRRAQLVNSRKVLTNSYAYNKDVKAVAVLSGRMLFHIASNTLDQYDMAPSVRWTGSIKLPGKLDMHSAMAACPRTRQIFIAHSDGISRLTLDGVVEPWITDKESEKKMYPKALSVTTDGHLLVVGETQLFLFGPHREQSRPVPIPDCYRIEDAVRTPSGTFFVTYRKSYDGKYRLAEVDADGKVVRNYTGAALLPHRLALDTAGKKLVVLDDSGRVVLLNERWEFELVLLYLKQYKIDGPKHMFYEESGRLTIISKDNQMHVFQVKHCLQLAVRGTTSVNEFKPTSAIEPQI